MKMNSSEAVAANSESVAGSANPTAQSVSFSDAIQTTDSGDKAMPKDAQVMSSIMKDMGISEWEPQVIPQLLEFAYRYVTTVLDDAKTVSGYARKKAVDVDDVRLAVQMYGEQMVTTPPSRDVLLEVARTKNNTSLPIPKPASGLRLPPEKYCLTACNYKLRIRGQKRPQTTMHQSSLYASKSSQDQSSARPGHGNSTTAFAMGPDGQPNGVGVKRKADKMS